MRAELGALARHAWQHNRPLLQSLAQRQLGIEATYTADQLVVRCSLVAVALPTVCAIHALTPAARDRFAQEAADLQPWQQSALVCAFAEARTERQHLMHEREAVLRTMLVRRAVLLQQLALLCIACGGQQSGYG